MLRIGLSILAWLLAAGPAAAQGTPMGAPPDAQIVVVTDINFPPYLFTDEDGQLKGILKDKWALWSERTGVPVDLRGMEWSRAQQTLLAGGADVIEALSYREDRKQLYEYSRPYAPVEARVYFHRSISGINDVASMRGFAVGAKEGSACGSWLRDRGVPELRTFPTSETLVKAAGAGEIRLFCMDAPAAQYYLYKLNVADEFRQSPPLYATQFHWAVKKGRAELRDFIEKGFDRISAKELEDINERWLGNPLQFPIGTRYLYYAGGLLAALLAMAALLLLWNRMLRTRVAARTAELRDLYDNAPCGYHSLDAEGRIVEINKTELAWLGRARDEVIGRRLIDFVTEAGRRQFEQVFDTFKKDGAIRDLEYELVHKDGSTTSVLLSSTAVRDAQGNYVRGRSTLYDVTDRQRARSALQASETRFRELAELSADWYWEQDENFRFVEHIGEHARYQGARPLDSLGLTRWEAHPASLTSEQWAAHRAILEAHQPFHDFEYLRGSRDGTKRWVSVSGRPVFDADGNFKGYRGVGTDITERKRVESEIRKLNEELERRVAELHTSEERFRSLTEFYASFVWQIDSDFRLSWIKGRTLADFGLSPETTIGRTLDEIDVKYELLAPTPEEFAGIRARREPYRDVRGKFTLADGTERFVSIWGEPIFRADGTFAGYRGLTQDITERVLLEHALKQLNEQLEQRVAMRTGELADANRELEAFAYSVSHDLRAPLRAIDRFAQMAIVESDGKVDPNVTRALQRVRAGSQRMAQLINDLLSLSRVTRIELLRQRIDLSALAADMVGELAYAEPARKVSLTVQPAMHVRADLNLLRILLDNLIGNAWKFTSGRERASIEIGSENCNGETAYFVRDNGAGFDMQYADKLFRAFERLHSEQEFPGTGIGLAIVERIVKRHGGRIWAEAALEKGATFRFTLGSSE